MKRFPHITESEWLIMDKLWEESPLTTAELVKRIQKEKNIGATTIKTLLHRLIRKKAVDFIIDKTTAKRYHYYSLVTKHDCITQKSQHFLSFYFEDNVSKMLAAFITNSDLSDEELKSLHYILEEKRGDLQK